MLNSSSSLSLSFIGYRVRYRILLVSIFNEQIQNKNYWPSWYLLHGVNFLHFSIQNLKLFGEA